MTKEEWYLLQLEMALYNLGVAMFGAPYRKGNNPDWFPHDQT